MGEEIVYLTLDRREFDLIVMALKIYEKVTDDRAVKVEILKLIEKISKKVTEKQEEQKGQ
ncbi:MAG: hypothetical protein NDF54_11275 [archaeon GB-1867-035]|nr:hypothetical protein [Candidatus Culexmicrobium profundum]